MRRDAAKEVLMDKSGKLKRLREKLSEKGEKMMKKLIVLLTAAAVLAAFASGAYAQSDTDDVHVYVTPTDINVAIAASPNTYGFGSVSLGSTATVSSDGKAAILTNSSDVNVTLEKKITQDGIAGGSITSTDTWKFADNYPTATLGTDWYKLWCLAKATSSAAGAPSWGDYDTAGGSWDVATSTSSKFNSKGSYNQVKDIVDNNILELGLSGSTSVWFAIEMPPSVSASDQREMLITFQATSK